jgi:hypothetical protein
LYLSIDTRRKVDTMGRHLAVSIFTIILVISVGRSAAHAQDWSIGGNMGLSSLDGWTGFQIAPTAEFFFSSTMGVGSELSINTQYGAPLLWYSYFKYSFHLPGSALRPYASAGPVMALNIPGAPDFGILFGAGVNIPIARGLSLVPDMIFGPVFGVGGGEVPFILSGYYWGYQTYGLSSYSVSSTTIFTFCIRGGIRYEL